MRCSFRFILFNQLLVNLIRLAAIIIDVLCHLHNKATAVSGTSPPATCVRISRHQLRVSKWASTILKITLTISTLYRARVSIITYQARNKHSTEKKGYYIIRIKNSKWKIKGESRKGSNWPYLVIISWVRLCLPAPLLISFHQAIRDRVRISMKALSSNNLWTSLTCEKLTKFSPPSKKTKLRLTLTSTLAAKCTTSW